MAPPANTNNPSLHSAKLQNILNPIVPEDQSHTQNNPPPYHMVVDPRAPIPNLRNPYDPEDEEKEDEDDLPEVTINATTQIRGHGNIISVPPMDAVRIAGLLHTMMYGPPGQQQHAPQQAAPNTWPHNNNYTSPSYSHTTQTHIPPYGTTSRTRMRFPKMNITVNCGATIFGDKNVVGPGLGDIARQMQLARSQQQAQAAAAAQAQAARTQGFQSQPIPAMSMPVPIMTPMMRARSESDSGRSDSSSSSGKRKAEGAAEFSPGAKRRDSHDY